MNDEPEYPNADGWKNEIIEGDSPIMVASPWLARWLNFKYHCWKRPKWFVLRLVWCSWRGHRLGTDSGILLGARMVNHWCARCDKMITIPLAEDDRFDQSL